MTEHHVRQLFQAIDSMSPEAFVSFLTDDAEFRFGNYPSVYGRDAIAATVDAFWKSIGGSSHTYERHWVDGDHVALQARVTYTRQDGKVVEVPFANVFEMRDGRIARYLIHIDNTPVFAP